VSSAKKKAPVAPVESVNQVRLISKAEVCDKVGRTFPTVWLWMRQGRFPRARDCGGRPAWLESDIDAWIAGLPPREYKADDTVVA
jgi:predicted DNA-binding transcriptional regulator AlpA